MSIATHVQVSIEDLTALVNIAEAFAPDENDMTGHIYWDAAERARKTMKAAGVDAQAIHNAMIEKAQQVPDAEGDIYAVQTCYRDLRAGNYTTPLMSREQADKEFDAMVALIHKGGIRGVYLLKDGVDIKKARA